MKHRFTTDDGIAIIKGFEAFSSQVYICPAGYPTVGFGHVVLENEKDGRFAGGISEGEAKELLKKDLFRAERSVLRLVNVPLSEGQFDALVSFAFNAGGGALQRSTLRMKLNRGESKEEVASEFLKWVYAGGRKLKGLVRRRMAEKELFLSCR